MTFQTIKEFGGIKYIVSVDLETGQWNYDIYKTSDNPLYENEYWR